MRKDFFSGFSVFAKDETKFVSYSNLNPKIIRASVLAKVSRNNAEVNAELEFTKMTRKYSKYRTTVRKYSKITIIIVIFV